MSTNRRDFIRLSAAAGGALGLGAIPGCADPMPSGEAGSGSSGQSRSLRIRRDPGRDLHRSLDGRCQVVVDPDADTG